MSTYIKYCDLEIYKLWQSLSDEVWKIYQRLRWQLQKIIGDQIVRSADSVGANIAEGYGRYHYLDKIKFYYMARASLNETEHWLELLYRRNIITMERHGRIKNLIINVEKGLNALIATNYNQYNQK